MERRDKRFTMPVAVIVVMAAILLQVVIPALFDLIISLGIGLGAGFIGYKIGKGSST